ncbi:MAG TPA: hypothetical protein PKK26_07945 [Candidatus Wallbacteria bacterium]|nr:hypothetical protein [Candidatus Wallbacteria bacterium]
MSERFLNGLIICETCREKLWFSPEGYVSCGCSNPASHKISADDIEAAVINDILEKLNDDDRLTRVADGANAALEKSNSRTRLTKDQVRNSLKAQYEKIYSSSNNVNKRKLTITLIRSISLLPDWTLEIKYNEI